MNKAGLILVASFIVLMAGCAHISKQAKEQLDKPVDCSTAEGDIAILEEERASAVKQMASGVRSIAPGGIVIGILKRDYFDGVRVATGKYNRDIEAKIKEIKDECNIP